MKDKVWEAITNNQSEEFKQIKGKVFTYKVKGNQIILNTTNQMIPKSEIEKALSIFPFKNTSVLQHLRAPSYIYGIMMDDRVKKVISKNSVE
ncbi:hypothetical protein J0L31_11390 [Terrisporobacter glycolicus]|nr:hypothetical protein [Terrisporobacter glycolicus]